MATAVVRYGAMGTHESFSPPDDEIKVGMHVVVRTPRGVEWGEVVKINHSDNGRERSDGEILRAATSADYEKQRDIVENVEGEEFKRCKQFIAKHGLPMKLRAVEHLFGGHKIIFYFMADGRVDFRGLVRDLAKEYRTRIEMRQIGVRDEARMMGLFGPCGRELCCRRFLNSLKPVPMKLAKDQKSTLDPAKISGSCGRLKCCLRYEEKMYKELKKKLPRRGTKVTTAGGDGTVVDYYILSQTVTVEMEDGGRQRLSLSEIERKE
ncbi:MAG: regulatory iron-sulfur-containing complex subunit RicT [Candidatus Brocadiia bacterium]